MLWIVAAALVVLWLLGMLVFEIASGLLHLALVIAAIVVIVRLVRSSKSSV